MKYWLSYVALCVTIIVVAALSAGPRAQQLDYGTLEQVFHEPVTTSATGQPQRASEAPVNMTIITQDDIRRTGATTIPDVLQYVAGVDVRRYGIADEEVGIRGYNAAYNPRLLVLVNGRQVYSDDYGRVFWPTVPVQLAEIRQIEVIEGPNSALYGFNAVSGVINIITFDPLHDRINTATLQGGTQHYWGGSAVATGQIEDRAGLRISVGGYQTQDYAPANLSAVDALNRRNPLVGAFNVDGRLQIAPGVQAYIDGSMSDSRFAEMTFEGSFETNTTRANSIRAGLSADTGIGLLSFSAYRNGQELSIDSSAVAGLPSWVNESVYIVQASDLLKLGADHVVRIGLEYRNNAETSPGFIGGTIGYQVYAGSLMWNWQITPSVALTNAVRVDELQLRYSGNLAAGSGFTVGNYNSTNFAVPSFNSGLVVAVTPQDTVRLMIARGVQLPSLFDFGVQIPFGAVGPVVIAGNPDVHPSTVDNIELDYDRALPAIDSGLRFAVFAQRNRDLISQPFAVPPVLGPTGLPLLLTSNVGSSNAMGAQIGIKGHADSGFRWNVSYAYVATTDNTVLNRGGLITSAINYANSTPRSVGIAGIGYTRDRWELDLMGRWQSSYQDFRASVSNPFLLEPVEVRNYVSLNARAAYRLTDNFTVHVSAQQFNASQLLQTAGPLVERRVLFGITAGF
ncbi:MAG TPA: TonB-dependent receptor plug domain-containing protein [Acetobacteraceae bacterium]|nr:TonB-dependent receptor plug domain-containing protein [Acetobacteraceae bacterium]